MSKVLIDIDAKDIASIKDGDILVFNEGKKCFYKQTAQEFWAKHNEELTRIIKRYDELVKNLEEKEKKFEKAVKEQEVKHEEYVANFIKEHEEQEKEFEEKVRDYLTKNKNITNKLIEMVENFIKTGGSL